MIARRSGSALLGFSSSSSSSASSAPSSSRLFATTAPVAQAPRPPRLVPKSHHLAKTPTPDSVYSQVQSYPTHPLLGFFAFDSRKITRRNAEGVEEDVEVSVPVALSERDLGKDGVSSRAWLAPELRKKSSVELHQLWYACLKERNRLTSTRDELRRSGARELARYANLNISFIDRRVRKTMARTKFVLNERRLALLEAQERALDGVEVEEEGADMLEEPYEEEGAAAAAAGQDPASAMLESGGSATEKAQLR